jgi:hypothetical protein
MARTLAGAALGMTQPQVRSALGEPNTTGAAPGSGLLEWRYASGVSVEFDEGPPITTSHVYGIKVRSPFAGATANGVKLGDSRDAFRLAYAAYAISERDNLTSAIDNEGVTLGGDFSTANRLLSLTLYVGSPPRR